MDYQLLSDSGALATAFTRRTRKASYRLPKGPLKDLVDEDVVERMPESVARENDCLPVHFDGETLHVAHSETDNIPLQDKLRFLLNCNVIFHYRRRTHIRDAINFFYGQIEGESCDSILQDFTNTMIDFTETEADCSPVNLSDINQLQAVRRMRRHPGSYSFGTRMPRKQKTENRIQSGEGMLFYTVREGHKVLAYRNGGEIEVVEGPARVWKGRSEFVQMRRIVAHPGEYLSVRFCDGSQQHIKGPAEIWRDPRIHSEIEVQQGLTLTTKEAVVVYGEDKNGLTQRRIVHGPRLFVPYPGEWLHRFSWHASRGDKNGAVKQPNALNFQKLWLMPDQMYHDVRDVRTADDAVLVIRLMIFFELINIEQMLDATHDPIGDFINAATSDVVEFTGKRSFEDFKKQTEQLNELSTYTQLLHRAKQSGYQINNVVYRGYGAPESLQKMHDEAIAARTSLQLNKETEKQTQELEDYRLQCQVERSQQRRLEQTDEVQHDIELQQKRESAKIAVEQKKSEFKREHARMDAELQNEIHRSNDQQQREHLEQLKTMGVELTEFLTQGRADQVIELRGRGGASTSHLHINQPSQTSTNGQAAKKGK